MKREMVCLLLTAMMCFTLYSSALAAENTKTDDMIVFRNFVKSVSVMGNDTQNTERIVEIYYKKSNILKDTAIINDASQGNKYVRI